jgi:hypothetical protein
MTLKCPAVAFSHNPFVAQQSSLCRLHNARFPTWVGALWVAAVVMLLLAGCGDDDHHEPVDDFIVSFPSDLEIFIRRSFGDPFSLLEVGVTPFVAPDTSPLPYDLRVSGIALSDGAEIVFGVQDVVRAAFLDPLGEQVVETLIVCDCFVDYVVLRSPFLDVTIEFD